MFKSGLLIHCGLSGCWWDAVRCWRIFFVACAFHLDVPSTVLIVPCRCAAGQILRRLLWNSDLYRFFDWILYKDLDSCSMIKTLPRCLEYDLTVHRLRGHIFFKWERENLNVSSDCTIACGKVLINGLFDRIAWRTSHLHKWGAPNGQLHFNLDREQRLFPTYCDGVLLRSLGLVAGLI